MRTLLTLLAVLALAVPVAADGCVPGNADPRYMLAQTPATGVAVSHEGPSSGEGVYYVFESLCFLLHNGPDCIGSFWVYQESNGIPGPQRGDEIEDNTCGGRVEADTIIF